MGNYERSFEVMLRMVLILSSALSTFFVFKHFVQLLSDSLVILFRHAAKFTSDMYDLFYFLFFGFVFILLDC